MPPSRPTLPNSQSLSFKNLSKAPSLTAEAFNYPNALKRTCSEDFRAGFSWAIFTHVRCFVYRAMTCWLVFVPSSILPMGFFVLFFWVCVCVCVNGAPHAHIAKTKEPITRAGGGDTFKGHAFLSRVYIWWEGWWLMLKTSTFEPCDIICQLGSGPDSVDGVKAVFWKTDYQA